MHQGWPLWGLFSPRDGNAIKADIVIYNLDTSARELSCGYTLTLDETPGTTPEGEHYDAIQRNIRYNHLAVVPRARAGSLARLNIDGEQVVGDEPLSNNDTDKEDKEMSDTKMTKTGFLLSPSFPWTHDGSPA